MSASSLYLAIVLRLIEQSVEAYRALLREHPLDWGEEATHRQQEAADLLDRAQTLGGALSGEEWHTFADHFATAHESIARLEELRGTFGYDPEEDEREDEDSVIAGSPTSVIRLIGGPLSGQTRELEISDHALPYVSDGDPVNRIELPHISGRDIQMLTYLREARPIGGQWVYYFIDPRDPRTSLEASVAMIPPSARLAVALDHLDRAQTELRKATDAGLQAGLAALKDAVSISQNELTTADQEVFAVHRREVQLLANAMEDCATYDPDWSSARIGTLEGCSEKQNLPPRGCMNSCTAEGCSFPKTMEPPVGP